MKFKIVFFGSVLLLCLGFTIHSRADKSGETEKHPEVDFTISCKECHKETSPEIYEDWAGSGHGKMNFGCYMCHGDGEEEFYVKPASDNCISCHSAQDVDFSQSKFNNCFDCHQGHSLKFHNE
jgi:hypothetical protein